MKKEAIRGRVRHRGSDKLILSKRFIAFLQEIRKEACAAKKKPAKPTLEKKSIASLQPKPLPFGLFCYKKKISFKRTTSTASSCMRRRTEAASRWRPRSLFRVRGELPIATSARGPGGYNQGPQTLGLSLTDWTSRHSFRRQLTTKANLLPNFVAE